MFEKNAIFHGLWASGTLKNMLVRGGVNCAKLFLLFVLLVSLTACGLTARSGKSYVINGQRYYILESAEGFKEKGLASWYGEPFHGRKTASGEVYDMHRISAAHKTLPLHTWVEVRNLDNNRVMTLRINDRGPFVRGRVIDLSRGAAERMGLLGPGTARVAIKAVTGDRARRLADEERRQAALEAQAALARAAQPKAAETKAAAKTEPARAAAKTAAKIKAPAAGEGGAKSARAPVKKQPS